LRIVQERKLFENSTRTSVLDDMTNRIQLAAMRPNAPKQSNQIASTCRMLLVAMLLPLAGCSTFDHLQLGYDMKEQQITLTMPIRKSTEGFKK
jgi:hypothetical protein